MKVKLLKGITYDGSQLRTGEIVDIDIFTAKHLIVKGYAQEYKEIVEDAMVKPKEVKKAIKKSTKK